MKITKEIRKALRIAVDSRGYGGQTKFANEAGIKPSYVSRYLSEDINDITAENWKKIWPLIKDYIDENESDFYMPKFKGLHTKPMVEIFEKLNNKNQRLVIDYAEELLDEQEFESNDELTQQELERLADLGVTCRYGVEFNFSLSGLCWLYNVILHSRVPISFLTSGRLRDYLKIDIPSGYQRELRVKLFMQDVYENKQYGLLVIYLDGSPPKLNTPYFCINGVGKIFTLKSNVKTAFILADNSVYYLNFSDQEYKDLIEEKTLKVPYPKIKSENY